MYLFTFFNTVGTCALILYNILQYRKKSSILSAASNSAMSYMRSRHNHGIGKLFCCAAFWAILELIIISMVQYVEVGFLNSGASQLFNTGANYFGVLYGAPILVVLFCILFKIDPLAQMDLITPAYPLALFFVKIACHFGGCCQGFEWEYGMYNPRSGLIEFPSPILESGVALMLFIVLLAFRNRFKKGTVFPIYLIAYSAIRFLTEFTRVEPAVFMGLKTYHFLCIAGVVLGLVEYWIVRCYEKKKNNATALIKE